MSGDNQKEINEKFLKDFAELKERVKGRTDLFYPGDILVHPKTPHNAMIVADNLHQLYLRCLVANIEYSRLNFIHSGSSSGTYRIEFDEAFLTMVYPVPEDLENKLIAPDVGGNSPPTDDKAIKKYFENYLISGVLEDNEHYRYSTSIVGLNKFKKGKRGGKVYQPLKHKGVPRGTRFNQLEWCIKHFVEKGYGTNHNYITIGCSEGLKRYDWFFKTEAERGTSECLRGIAMNLRENKDGIYELDFELKFRSWDLIGGLPENLGGFIYLMQYTSNMINALKKDSQPEVKPGKITAVSNGLHTYQHHLPTMKKYLNIN